MTKTKPIYLLTIDLSMFGEGGAPAGASGAAPAAGEGGAPAAAEAAPEVRYGKQPEQTAAPQQQTHSPEPVDKGKTFRELIKGEYKQEYADETQKLINRRFRDTDTRLQAMQPIIDMLDARYGTQGDMARLLATIEGDTAYWQEAAEAAGMTVEQYQAMQKLERQNRQLLAQQKFSQQQYLAQQQYAKWQVEAEQLKAKYPDFDLDVMEGNDLFTLMLKNNYPMEQAYKACVPDQIAAQAAAQTEKAVTDNIRARGNRPPEAGASTAPAFTVKDDVSKLSDQDVLNILKQIGNGGRVTFS